SLSARAPKLIRLANGVAEFPFPAALGVVAAMSASSTADSSSVPEPDPVPELLLEKDSPLPRGPDPGPLLLEVVLLPPKGLPCPGAALRPRVVRERRRRWAWAAAEVMGPGKGDVVWGGEDDDGGEYREVEPGLEPGPKRSAKVWPAKEERRREVAVAGGEEEFVVGSSDMVVGDLYED
ncbi:MAG: hypothetical protein Q9157_003789, partial [Trypethelium eluteriae]